MKLKASEWKSACDEPPIVALLDFLRSQANGEADVNLTPSGIEIVTVAGATEVLACLKQAALDLLRDHTAPVTQVEDPYVETGVSYVVIDIDPCSPLIREVPKGTANSYPTLVDAKSAARQVIQASMARATNSLAELRQVGVKSITYIAL